MAIAVVQFVGAAAELVDSVTTADITTTPGNLLHADETAFGQHFVSLEDSKSNVWVETGDIFRNVVLRQEYAKDILGGAGHNFTLTLDSPDYPTFAVTEISGLDPDDPKDQHSIDDQLAVPPSSSGPITTMFPDEILCGCGTQTASGGSPMVIDPDYIERFHQPTTSQLEGLITGTRIVSAEETNDFNFSYTGQNAAGAAVTSYKAAADGGGGFGAFQRRRRRRA